jgi:glycosyltransferase involved in cell wall biosynthesis
LVDALTRVKADLSLTVIGYETIGHIGYSHEFIAAARGAGVEEAVSFEGPIPRRAAMLEHIGKADVGLALVDVERGDFNLRSLVGPSNKPFDYLARGVAVLVPEDPAWREMFVEPGYGLSCDPHDPESIAEALRWFADHLGETRNMGERGRKRILEEWNYETQFAPVLRHLED